MITTTTYRQRRRLAQQQHALICASLILNAESGITFDALLTPLRNMPRPKGDCVRSGR